MNAKGEIPIATRETDDLQWEFGFLLYRLLSEATQKHLHFFSFVKQASENNEMCPCKAVRC